MLPAERQQLPGQRGSAPRGGKNLLKPRLGATSRFDRIERKLGVVDDNGKKVVEVVRHAAGQPADGIHFLGLKQLLFEMQPVGEIAGSKSGSPSINPTETHRLLCWCDVLGLKENPVPSGPQRLNFFTLVNQY